MREVAALEGVLGAGGGGRQGRGASGAGLRAERQLGHVSRLRAGDLQGPAAVLGS